ncbi:MAG: AAA family ATPase [Candidatus Nanoarchaeia archaeon]
MNVIGFVSIKGGVGKTTLALETAACLANKYDKRVLLIDANFSAPNVSLYLDLTKEEGLYRALDDLRKAHASIYEAHGFDVIPNGLYDEGDPTKLKRLVDKLKGRYDFIIIDSSPNYYELAPVVMSADRLFLVTTADNVTLQTSLKAAHLARKKKTPVEGLIVNKIRHPRYELSLQRMEEQSGIPILAKIRDDKKAAESIYYKKPLSLHSPNHHISKEIRNFVSSLIGEPEQPGFFQKILPFNFSKEKVNRQLYRQMYEPQL